MEFTQDDVRAYFVEIGMPNAMREADKYWNYNESRLWRRGHVRIVTRSQMEATVRSWKLNAETYLEERRMAQERLEHDRLVREAQQRREPFELSALEQRQLHEQAALGDEAAKSRLRLYFHDHPEQRRAAERFFREVPSAMPAYWADIVS
ncbi:MAG: hypothetical protein IJR86_03705 [Bacteroidaceae bacterium]|jgi:hypothetical protein|nr:hypothetical protein [Bacteroidaceae bacterium]